MLASLKAISSLMISLFILMTGFGIASYVTPLRALGEGWTATDIAMIGAVYSVGYTLSSFITPIYGGICVPAGKTGVKSRSTRMPAASCWLVC